MLNKSKANPVETKELCEYGCGQRAKFRFKTGIGINGKRTRKGKFCCSDFYAKCPINIEKNRQRNKGKKPSPQTIEASRKVSIGRKPWHFGLTKDTDERLKQKTEKLKQRYASGELKNFGHSHDDETKRRMSVIAVKNKNGGYIKGSGIGKKGWYKGYWCDSSWELAYVIFNLEHNIPFKRNTEKFQYEHENKIKNWIPDFILEDNSYVEIKGYFTEKVSAKLKNFERPIKLLMKNELKEVFEYVTNRYGKDYIRLYEK
jgi:hypothetical protein